MYILSADKKKLINFSKLSVCKNFGGKKEEKYALTAQIADSGLAEIVGLYPDEKMAELEMQKIAEALKENKQVYEI